MKISGRIFKIAGITSLITLALGAWYYFGWYTNPREVRARCWREADGKVKEVEFGIYGRPREWVENYYDGCLRWNGIEPK